MSTRRNSIKPNDVVTVEPSGNARANHRQPSFLEKQNSIKTIDSRQEPKRNGNESIIQSLQSPSVGSEQVAGLECLKDVDKLFIQKEVNHIESWKQNNKYIIRNSSGDSVFNATELSAAIMRVCCNEYRGFVVHILDSANQECFKITREFKCCTGCCWFAEKCAHCASEIKVETPNGHVFGYLKQKASMFGSEYDVLDASHDVVMKIKGPDSIFGALCCSVNSEFQLKTFDGVLSGKIAKKYDGFKDIAVPPISFMLEFPKDVSNAIKATLLAASFLIDFVFFDHY